MGLLAVEETGEVRLMNQAAKDLFRKPFLHHVNHLATLDPDLPATLLALSPGGRRLRKLVIDGSPVQLSIQATRFKLHQRGYVLLSFHDIRYELEAQEVEAWQKLIRVLTHEIMNSMTPVTSLAQSAAALMVAADKGTDPDVSDARAAVERLARRAEGVMHFVESYRQISRTPEIRRREFEILPWARELEAIFRASDKAEGVAFRLEVERDTLTIDCDPDLMSQVLINLLRNAAEAAVGHAEQPEVRLSFTPTKTGRAQIEVADNGPGVPEAIRRDVFLPFFTTKAKGTGVGLSLARQIVLAHRGSIALCNSESGGALFRLLI
jgi:nitrogen fixation/metabolism regulation signal transduction histidine kinase